MRDANGILIVLAGLAIATGSGRLAVFSLVGILIVVKLFQGWRILRRKA